MFEVRLFGPFIILDANGRDVTPRGAKAQAIIALLLASPDWSRSRIWLQDKLWSDRTPAQAAGSLRQALYEIRTALGQHNCAILTDRRIISLISNAISFRPRQVGQDYLEGIDVGDPEFEDWLSLQRSISQPTDESATTAPVALAARTDKHRIEPMSIAIVIEDDIPEPQGLVVQLIADVFVQALQERAVAEVRMATNDDQADLTLELRYHRNPGVLRAQMQTRIGARHVWAQTLSPPQSMTEMDHHESVAKFVNSGVEAAIAASLRQDYRTTAAGHFGIHQAVRRIFGFQARDLVLADAQLLQLGTEHPAALGWRIFLKMVQRVECAVPATAAFAEEVEDLMQEALARAPDNAITLSAAAHACIKVLDRPEDALVLAHRALRNSWANPFALDAVADALLIMGRSEDAYLIARRAQNVGQSTPMSHFFDMGLSLACVATGRPKEALAMARQAAALAPNFRPALRYSAILNANAGHIVEARRAVDRLRAAEPTFDLCQMLQDPAYPVATIRNAGLAGLEIQGMLQ